MKRFIGFVAALALLGGMAHGQQIGPASGIPAAPTITGPVTITDPANDGLDIIGQAGVGTSGCFDESGQGGHKWCFTALGRSVGSSGSMTLNDNTQGSNPFLWNGSGAFQVISGGGLYWGSSSTSVIGASSQTSIVSPVAGVAETEDGNGNPALHEAKSFQYSTITFSNLPSATSGTVGETYLVSNLGTNGVVVVSTGSNWRPLNGVATLAVSGAVQGYTGSTAQTNLANVKIPAGLLSANGQLRIIALWHGTGGGGKTTIINISTVQGDVSTGSNFYDYNQSATGGSQVGIVVRNYNSTSSQVGINGGVAGGWGNPGGTNATASINTATTAFYVNFNGICDAGGSDEVYLDSYSVEWVEP